MAKTYLIGVDIGTQGTKTVLYDTQGTQVESAFEASVLINPATGAVEQEPDEIYGSVLRTIRFVVDKSGISASDVAAIGIDGQMAGILGVDKDFAAVTPYDSWLDTRCSKYVDHIKELAEEKVISKTGCPVTFAHGPKILWWKHERPEAYSKIAKFLVPSAYVAGRLAGISASDAFIDYTQIHFSGFADTDKMRWADDLIEIFGISADKMPRILKPWDVIGRLSARAAEHCSLKSGIQIVAGCGDQAASSLGAGITRKGLIFDVAGTASVFSCSVDSFKPDVKNKTLVFARSVLPGLWIPLAYISGGGLCLKWFRDEFAKGAGYSALDELAEAVPAGSDGLIFFPHFTGRTCPYGPQVRGAWLGLGFKHSQGHLYRSILEGIAYEYRYYLTLLRELVPDMSFDYVTAVGGGADSRVFNTIKASVLGIPYRTLVKGETATLGSAVTAGFGAGVFDDLAGAVGGIVKMKDEVYFPEAQASAVYEKYASAYAGLFDWLKGPFKGLCEING